LDVEVKFIFGLALLLIEAAESRFGQDEVSFIWIVFHWSPKNDVTSLELCDRWTFHQSSLRLVLIEKVVPEIML
jgi:hypothetical protein